MKYTKLKNYEKFKDFLIDYENTFYGESGLRYLFKFPNGYGASVIKNIGSYGNKQDLFEVALLKDGEIEYGLTIIPNGVVGFLTNDEVLDYLERIKNE